MNPSSAEKAARKNGDDAPSSSVNIALCCAIMCSPDDIINTLHYSNINFHFLLTEKLEDSFEQLCVDGHKQDRTTPNDVSRDTMNSKQLPTCQTIGTKNQEGSEDKHERKEFDEILFRQLECSHWGECPICLLPLSHEDCTKTYFNCCSKTICTGCRFAQCCQNPPKSGRQCPFCRTPIPKTRNDIWDKVEKRIEVGDQIAMVKMGNELVDKDDFKGAFEYFSRAASLENIEAQSFLGAMYYLGQGVERDEAKAVHHLEQASIGGHRHARYYLAQHEQNNGRMERAGKHFIISAKLGHNDALEQVKEYYRLGFVSREDFAAALRGHQAAIDAKKSDQRKEAADYLANTQAFSGLSSI